MNAAILRELALDVELHSNVLQRALGRGGAPPDLVRARSEVPFLQAALFKLVEALPRDTKGGAA